MSHDRDPLLNLYQPGTELELYLGVDRHGNRASGLAVGPTAPPLADPEKSATCYRYFFGNINHFRMLVRHPDTGVRWVVNLAKYNSDGSEDPDSQESGVYLVMPEDQVTDDTGLQDLWLPENTRRYVEYDNDRECWMFRDYSEDGGG